MFFATVDPWSVGVIAWSVMEVLISSSAPSGFSSSFLGVVLVVVEQAGDVSSPPRKQPVPPQTAGTKQTNIILAEPMNCVWFFFQNFRQNTKHTNTLSVQYYKVRQIFVKVMQMHSASNLMVTQPCFLWNIMTLGWPPIWTSKPILMIGKFQTDNGQIKAPTDTWH